MLVLLLALCLTAGTLFGCSSDSEGKDEPATVTIAQSSDPVSYTHLFNDGIAVVRCIKTDADLHGVYGKLRCRNRYMTELTVYIDDLKVHHLNILFFYELHNIFSGSFHFLPPQNFGITVP